MLKDSKGILIQQTENVQAGRQVRFTDVQQIKKIETTLKAYIREAIDIEKSGLKVEYRKTTDLKLPEEFQARMDRDGALKKAFESLTPGRQKAYIFYFSQAKQPKTREARMEKCVPRIRDGLGLDD